MGHGVILLAAHREFVETAGLQGPNGEGVPGAVLAAMCLDAALLFCPWLLAAFRGSRAIAAIKRSAPEMDHLPGSTGTGEVKR